jgi:hypothetical protein
MSSYCDISLMGSDDIRTCMQEQAFRRAKYSRVVHSVGRVSHRRLRTGRNQYGDHDQQRCCYRHDSISGEMQPPEADV